MICIIEAQCFDWEHEQVNAALIDLVKNTFSEDRIVIQAEKKHINRLNRLLSSKDNLDYKEINIPNKREESIHYMHYYYFLFKKIIDENSGKQLKLIFMSVNKGILLAIRKLSREYPEVLFYPILHAILEEIIEDKKEVSLRFYIKSLIKSKGKYWRTQISLNELLSKSGKNVKFITYAPYYREILKSIIGQNVINNIFFLNHPVISIETNERSIDNKKIIIGVYGQALTKRAIEIISETLNYDHKNIVSFYIISKNKPAITHKNLIWIDANEHGENVIEDNIEKFDFVLIPYNSKQYKLSASGIFWDAVKYNIPVIVLDSIYFNYYVSNEIGIIGKNNNVIIDNLLINDNAIKNYSTFYSNINILKEKCKLENMKLLNEILNSDI